MSFIHALRHVYAARNNIKTCNTSLIMRTFSTNANIKTEEGELRDIMFKQDEQDALIERPFQIVGIRDAEVYNYNYPSRFEPTSKKKVPRTPRNRFNAPNFISMYVDNLQALYQYIQDQNIPINDNQGIHMGPDGYETLVIPPSEDGSSIEEFNLCNEPAFVEFLQATKEMIQEYEENKKQAELDAIEAKKLPQEDPYETYEFKATYEVEKK